jgi:ABC-type uncharacterized transport system permease subunit
MRGEQRRPRSGAALAALLAVAAAGAVWRLGLRHYTGAGS